MPNLKPPVTTVEAAEAYRDRIISAVPTDTNFDPLMTLYFTDGLKPDEIKRAQNSESIIAVKYYPAGATTNSDSGVTDIQNTYPVLEAMIQADMPLLIHGEVTDDEVDIFDREQRFIDEVLEPLITRYPELRIVLEHITTKNAVDFVREQKETIAATITVHHLLFNRNNLLAGGIRPHYYCLPVLKRNTHQAALIDAATSGETAFFLGTDSAPHEMSTKETDCGCAGIYSSPAAIELYAEVFESHNALDKLEGFASHHGADFYRLPRNQSKIVLTKASWKMAEKFDFEEGVVIPIRAGENISWQLSRNDI